MHPFLPLLLGIIGYIILRTKGLKESYIKLLALFIFVYMNIEVGSVYGAGDGRIKYTFVVEFFCIFYALILIVKNAGRIGGKDAIKLLLAIATTLTGMIALKLWPLQKYIVTGDMLIDDFWLGEVDSLQLPALNGFVVKTFIQYGIFLFILFSIYLSFQKEDYEKLLEKLSSACKIIIAYGWIEFLVKNLARSNILFTLNNIIFGSNNAVFSELERRGMLYRLCGLMTEPSHFSYALFLIAILFLANYQLGKMSFRWIIQAFLLMILSMSFSSVIFALAFLTIFFISRYRKNIRGEKVFQIFLWCLLAFSILYIVYRSGILDSSYFGKRMKAIFDDWGILFTDVERVRDIQFQSSRVRLISSFSTLALLRFRPFFGIGIGTTSSHGSFSSILSGMGILGTLSWLLMLFYGRAAKIFRHYGSAYFLMILLWCIIGIFNGHFWGMLYNAENYALMISFLVLSRRGERA